MTISRVAFDDPDTVALRGELEREHEALYGEDTEPGAKPTAEDTPVFLVVRQAGEAIACGGLRPAGDGVVELKRMYVRPAARGRGVARELLGALEAEARALGGTRVVLETGDAQEAAIALYVGAGYREVPCTHGHERSRCFERAL